MSQKIKKIQLIVTQVLIIFLALASAYWLREFKDANDSEVRQILNK